MPTAFIKAPSLSVTITLGMLSFEYKKMVLFKNTNGFLKVEGKKMVVGVRTDGFCSKTGTLRELTYAA